MPNIKRKNRVILALKVQSLAELKFDPGFRVIGEYLSQIDSILRVNLNWLSISSLFEWNILQLLGIPGRILVPPVDQIFRSKRLLFSVQTLQTFLAASKGGYNHNSGAGGCQIKRLVFIANFFRLKKSLLIIYSNFLISHENDVINSSLPAAHRPVEWALPLSPVRRPLVGPAVRSGGFSRSNKGPKGAGRPRRWRHAPQSLPPALESGFPNVFPSTGREDNLPSFPL